MRNKADIPLAEVTGKKVWVGQDSDHPEIKLQLFRTVCDDPEAKREPVGEPVVLEPGTTSYTWTDLPTLTEGGQVLTYSVDEVEVPEGWEKQVSEDGLTVTNKKLPPPTVPTTEPTTVPTTSPKPGKPGLPRTGVSVAGFLLLAGGLLGVGVALTVASRRKND